MSSSGTKCCHWCHRTATMPATPTTRSREPAPWASTSRPPRRASSSLRAGSTPAAATAIARSARSRRRSTARSGTSACCASVCSPRRPADEQAGQVDDYRSGGPRHCQAMAEGGSVQRLLHAPLGQGVEAVRLRSGTAVRSAHPTARRPTAERLLITLGTATPPAATPARRHATSATTAATGPSGVGKRVVGRCARPAGRQLT
jgi:hypothetical protein